MPGLLLCRVASGASYNPDPLLCRVASGASFIPDPLLCSVANGAIIFSEFYCLSLRSDRSIAI
jgi:hypothetical protein